MKLLSVLLPAVLVLGVACQSEESSDVKLTKSNNQALVLDSGYFGEDLGLNEANISLEIIADGRIDYTIRAEMAIADIVMQEFSFKRLYQMNPAFVQYATYANADDLTYSEKGQDLASILKKSDVDGLITLLVNHYATGLKAEIAISKGENGLVSIESAQLSGATEVAVKDPSGETETVWQGDEFFHGSFIEKAVKVFGLFSGSISLSKK